MEKYINTDATIHNKTNIPTHSNTNEIHNDNTYATPSRNNETVTHSKLYPPKIILYLSTVHIRRCH